MFSFICYCSNCLDCDLEDNPRHLTCDMKNKLLNEILTLSVSVCFLYWCYYPHTMRDSETDTKLKNQTDTITKNWNIEHKSNRTRPRTAKKSESGPKLDPEPLVI